MLLIRYRKAGIHYRPIRPWKIETVMTDLGCGLRPMAVRWPHWMGTQVLLYPVNLLFLQKEKGTDVVSLFYQSTFFLWVVERDQGVSKDRLTIAFQLGDRNLSAFFIRKM